MVFRALYDKIKQGLAKTRDVFTGVAQLFRLKGRVDQDFLKELEKRLYLADVGSSATSLIVDRVRQAVEARPGAIELVERLRQTDVQLGLASNSPRALVDDALRSAHLTDAFEVIVTSDDVQNAKPAPDIYLLACERLGVAAADALALEDSASGVAAAKAAGLTVIAVPQFAETDVSAADRIVDSLEELLAD